MGGESAGAHATLYHMMTAGSKCLFQRAIALSPPGVEVPTAAVASKTADYLLKNLDCDTSENKLSCLRGKTAGDIHCSNAEYPVAGTRQLFTPGDALWNLHRWLGDNGGVLRPEQ